MSRYRTALECLMGVPATDGNEVRILRDGDEAFPAMLDAIRTAEATVDMHTFGHWNGAIGAELTDLLVERARAGVRVRVLLDAFGARHIERDLIECVARAGADVHWFRPLTWRVTQATHRGHRKVLVCDNRVAFSGGIGISDRWCEYRDTAVRVRGPAVNGLKGAFLNNWAETRQPLFDKDIDPFPEHEPAGSSAVQVVRGDAETGWGDLSTLVRAFVGLARSRLRISTSYFVPDADVVRLLCDAAQRGVSVEVLLPGGPVGTRLAQLATEASCARLLAGGVRVWSYPGGLRNSAMVADGAMASVGAMDFNSRSLTLNDEVNVVVFDPEVVRVVDAHIEQDIDRAARIETDEWAQRGLVRRAAGVVPGFLARHL
ncbi:MAG: phospholipase D-like domain-containing protein [Acidimicrobiales bacterium]